MRDNAYRPSDARSESLKRPVLSSDTRQNVGERAQTRLDAADLFWVFECKRLVVDHRESFTMIRALPKAPAKYGKKQRSGPRASFDKFMAVQSSLAEKTPSGCADTQTQVIAPQAPAPHKKLARKRSKRTDHVEPKFLEEALDSQDEALLFEPPDSNPQEQVTNSQVTAACNIAEALNVEIDDVPQTRALAGGDIIASSLSAFAKRQPKARHSRIRKMKAVEYLTPAEIPAVPSASREIQTQMVPVRPPLIYQNVESFFPRNENHNFDRYSSKTYGGPSVHERNIQSALATQNSSSVFGNVLCAEIDSDAKVDEGLESSDNDVYAYLARRSISIN